VTIDAEELTCFTALIPELGGNNHLITSFGNRTPDQFLVNKGSVHVGRVEKVSSGVEIGVDRGEGLGVVERTVKLTHSHASKTLLRDDEPLT
jgi:hypothetical protein